MNKVRSSDGTPIAFDRLGDGPPIILVVGAFNERSTGMPLAEALAPDFTVFTYDRRGRGDSGDTAPYAVDREIDDLDALIAEASGSAAVFGYSSGAVLALKAVARGLAITRLALYEPPLAGEGAPAPAEDFAARLSELVSAGRRGDAVEYFQTRVVGIPAEVVGRLRDAPFRAALEKMAHTLVYEVTITGDGSIPPELAAGVTVPTLVIGGEESPEGLRKGAQAVAKALPDARLVSLPGQTHDIVPAVVAPVIKDFLTS
ncbi:alpha/beta hydrolase [Sphaerisporangium sp. NPDC088356]|uniref:alpha/beta fold hydrolase n=1 Tax=Sphaerisporangium sp. NPDC088356 TaxID=3154871 RepID=UPI003437FADF